MFCIEKERCNPTCKSRAENKLCCKSATFDTTPQPYTEVKVTTEASQTALDQGMPLKYVKEELARELARSLINLGEVTTQINPYQYTQRFTQSVYITTPKQFKEAVKAEVAKAVTATVEAEVAKRLKDAVTAEINRRSRLAEHVWSYGDMPVPKAANPQDDHR